MKKTQRHHLKDNELALLLGHVQDFVELHKRTLTMAVGVAVVLAVAVGGYLAWRNSINNEARTLLAEAMVIVEAPVAPPAPPAGESLDQPAAPAQQPGTYPTDQARLEAALPKLLAAADTFPDTDAGLTARYEAASALVALSRFDEAIAQYQQVIDGGSGVHARMARLGKAEAQLRAGQHDEAIAGFRAAADEASTTLPKEAVLLELARAYQLAGKPEDARTTLNEIIEQHAESPIAAVAREELDKIKG